MPTASSDAAPETSPRRRSRSITTLRGQAAGATAQLSGSLGATRVDGRVQLKGSLAEWRAGQFSGQLALSAADGNKLIALLSTKGRGRIGRFHLSWHDHDPRQWHARPARHLHHGQGAIAASADRWGGGIKEGILLFRQSASLHARRLSNSYRLRLWRSLAGSGNPA